MQKNQRARSLAQDTKEGYVYIISNIGSFGENIYKIGMSRRAEPLERVQELSGASVPFNFDVHGLIFSRDAVSLENSLHKKLESYRLNPINKRREFFKTNINEIETAIKEIHGEFIELKKEPDALEFRQILL